MSGLPATVANLDPAVVVEVHVRHRCNVTDASADLGVPASDLRRLLWNNPKLQDEAFEVVEVRLDKAEKNIAEALDGDDSRCSDAASFFVLRNSARARRRGWITTSTSAAELSVSTGAPTARIRGRPMRLRGRSTRASCLSTIPTSVPTAGRRRSTADLTPRDRRRLADVRAPRPSKSSGGDVGYRERSAEARVRTSTLSRWSSSFLFADWMPHANCASVGQPRSGSRNSSRLIFCGVTHVKQE